MKNEDPGPLCQWTIGQFLQTETSNLSSSIKPIFQDTKGAYRLQTPVSAVHHITCTVKSRRHVGQVFTFARFEIVEYCANQNATLAFSKAV